jgi:hypothetical protein
MSQIQAKIIEHSTTSGGIDLLTYQLAYPRFIHSELMTHRVFSRNASSSRAIPVAKMIEQVRRDPAMPIHWGKNQPGMQAHEEHDAPVLLELPVQYDNPADVPLYTFERCTLSVQDTWREAASQIAIIADAMNAAGYHKQVVNRLLEPFQIIHVIVTATEWSNFFELRAHPDAQPEIHALAVQMLKAREGSIPTLRGTNPYSEESWHLPYVTAEERAKHRDDPRYLAKLSAARCARVSYLTHDGKTPDPVKDIELYERLVGSRPLHASPVEHQAYPDRHPLGSDEWFARNLHGNFNGWVQHRKLVELEVF